MKEVQKIVDLYGHVVRYKLYKVHIFPKEIATIIKSNSYLINNLYAYVLVRFSYIVTSLTTIQVKLYLYLLEM